MFLICVDTHSKWPEVIEMGSTTAERTVDELCTLFGAYGLPNQIFTDNGPQFISAEFATFLKSNGIKHIRCSPYHPSSNGAAERFMRTFKEATKTGHHDGKSLKHRLANFLLTYRTTPHATTNETPCILFFGRSIRTRLDLMRPSTDGTVQQKQAVQKKHHDRCTHLRELDVGQPVLVKNCQPGSDWIRGVVKLQLGPLAYQIELSDGRMWKRHVDHIKPFNSLPSTALPVTIDISNTSSNTTDVTDSSSTSDVKELVSETAPTVQEETSPPPCYHVLIPLQVITLVEIDDNQTAIMIPTCTLDRKGGRCGDLM